MTVLLAVATLRGTDDRAIPQALVIGGFPQIPVRLANWLTDIAIRAGRLLTTARSSDDV